MIHLSGTDLRRLPYLGEEISSSPAGPKHMKSLLNKSPIVLLWWDKRNTATILRFSSAPAAVPGDQAVGRGTGCLT